MSGPRSLTVECPLPPEALSPNGSYGHWSTHAKVVREYREYCGWKILERVREQQWVRPCGVRVDISLTVVLCGRTPGFYRPRDPSNIVSACKPLIDGIIDGQALYDDDVHCVRSISASVERHTRCKCHQSGVRVTVREIW